MNGRVSRWVTRQRWAVAEWLDARGGWCWAQLVTWVIWREPRLRDCHIDATCERDCERNGLCYCGRDLMGEIRAPASGPTGEERE